MNISVNFQAIYMLLFLRFIKLVETQFTKTLFCINRFEISVSISIVSSIHLDQEDNWFFKDIKVSIKNHNI